MYSYIANTFLSMCMTNGKSQCICRVFRLGKRREVREQLNHFLNLRFTSSTIAHNSEFRLSRCIFINRNTLTHRCQNDHAAGRPQF